MTKKDYILITNALRAVNAPASVIQSLATALKSDNVRFDAAKFISASTCQEKSIDHS